MEYPLNDLIFPPTSMRFHQKVRISGKSSHRMMVLSTRDRLCGSSSGLDPGRRKNKLPCSVVAVIWNREIKLRCYLGGLSCESQILHGCRGVGHVCLNLDFRQNFP